MFGLKKRRKKVMDIQQELQSAVKPLERAVKSLEGAVVDCVREESARESVARVESRLKKQEGVLEEAVELLDGCQTELEKLNRERQAEMQASQKLEAEKQEIQKQEAGLLELVMMYGEYMENLYRLMQAVGGDGPEWRQQWELMQAALERTMAECQVEIIRPDGRQADPSKVVVVKMEPASDPQLHNCVSETVIPGWIYQGVTVKKARVAVYKCGSIQM